MSVPTPSSAPEWIPPPADPEISIIVPVYNEEACITDTLLEVLGVLKHMPYSSEVLVINDGSTDRTEELARRLVPLHSGLRIFRLAENTGQSAAFGVGFRHCRAPVVVLMDGDGQNDPLDIPILLDALENCDVVCGYRLVRHDVWSKRAASRCANRVRRFLLRDGMRDTGCSLKAMRREWLADLPMEFRGMHRFLPALLQMRGARVVEVAVQHRARAGGYSKYTNGQRLRETIHDLRAVRWMQRRYREINATEWTGAS